MMAEVKPDVKTPTDFGELRILLVEDSEFDRELALATLTKLGLTGVQVAESGRVATSKIQNAFDIRKPFNLILLDVKMPGQDGISVLKWLRNEPKLKTTSVIMITSTASLNEVTEFVGMGISGYVVKPIRLEILGAKIQEAVVSMKRRS